MATSVRTEGTRVRSDLLTRALEVMNPQLTQEEHRRLFAVIRLLTGSVAWKVMTDDLGLDTDDSVEATSWAVRTLLADIESVGVGSRHLTLEHDMGVVTTICVPLLDGAERVAADVGSKARNLAELKRAGFAVPDGFVITTAAFTRSSR